MMRRNWCLQAFIFPGTDDPNRGPLDRLENVIDGTDDPNRGPLDRAANALDGTDDPTRGPIDRLENALDGEDDPNRGPIDRLDTNCRHDQTAFLPAAISVRFSSARRNQPKRAQMSAAPL